MAIPEGVKRAQQRYLEQEGVLVDHGTRSTFRSHETLVSSIPATVCRSFGLDGTDEVRVFADYEENVLLQQPADVAREVGPDV